MRNLTEPASPARKRKLSHSPTATRRYPNSPAQTPRTTSPPTLATLAVGRSPSLIQPSSFRNVSSCNRCRLRKTRCDQRLPRCRPCEKAGARCVSYDTATKREIPRSYVYYLEARIDYLTGVLTEHKISFKDGSAFDEFVVKTDSEGSHTASHFWSDNGTDNDHIEKHRMATPETPLNLPIGGTQRDNRDPVLLLGIEDYSIRSKLSGRAIPESLSTLRAETRDMDYFVLPPRPVAEKLAKYYFSYANPQMPALLKGEFMELFDRAYSGYDRSPRSLYFLHIVFAIGAGIVFDGRCSPVDKDMSVSQPTRRRKNSNSQCQPRDHHVNAVKCLELSLTSCDGGFSALGELQAVILLAHFSLLQPVAPGPAHLAEVAMRTAVNMGLYCEEEAADASFVKGSPSHTETSHQDRLRDLRRRLWWCAYSLDRLVAPYIGRPFGISDQLITTEFPSLLDKDITDREPYSKRVTHHYFQLRILQSEIHEVFQYQRALGAKSSNKRKACTNLSPPFLPFDSIPSWRKDMNRRLDEWKSYIPDQKTGGSFPVVLLELDYWQTINHLYRQSIEVPPELIDMTPATDPARYSSGETELDNSIYLKVVEASGKVLQLYRLMHHVQLVEYTYLATHSIFFAGSSFLFAIWHSPFVRSQLTLNEIDYTLLAGITILADMADGYPHASSCRSALERMGAATVQMYLSTTEFGSQAKKPCTSLSKGASPWSSSPSRFETQLDECKDIKHAQTKRISPHLPQFDMNLEGLLSGLHQNQKPREGRTQSPHEQIYKDFNPTLPKEIPQFPFSEYQDLASPGSTPPRQQPYNTIAESISPITIPWSYDQSFEADMERAISLDFFEFDLELGDSDVLPFSADDGLARREDFDSPFGEETGDLGFSIDIDSQHRLGKGIYDRLEASLV